MVYRTSWIALALVLTALCLAEAQGMDGGDTTHETPEAESLWMAATLRLARSLNMDDDVAPALLRRLQSLPDIEVSGTAARQARRLLGTAPADRVTLTLDRKTYATKAALINALINGDENEDELEEQEERLWELLLQDTDADAEGAPGLGGFIDFSP